MYYLGHTPLSEEELILENERVAKNRQDFLKAIKKIQLIKKSEINESTYLYWFVIPGLGFKPEDFVEIMHYALIGFRDAFILMNPTSNSDLGGSDDFRCGEITPDVEDFVVRTVDSCRPLESVFGKQGAKFARLSITEPKDEDSCVTMKVIGHLLKDSKIPTDNNLIDICSTLTYWCCCETVKKVSPVIAKATLNLIEYI
jgi:hypothetical protein